MGDMSPIFKELFTAVKAIFVSNPQEVYIKFTGGSGYSYKTQRGLEEAITIMKALWRDGSANFSGKHYTVTNAQGLPRPVTNPYPTFVIGGGG